MQSTQLQACRPWLCKYSNAGLYLPKLQKLLCGIILCWGFLETYWKSIWLILIPHYSQGCSNSVLTVSLSSLGLLWLEGQWKICLQTQWVAMWQLERDIYLGLCGGSGRWDEAVPREGIFSKSSYLSCNHQFYRSTVNCAEPELCLSWL